MGDLIERLRGMNEYWQHAPLYNEAADEIERVETFNRANWAALQEAQRQIERLTVRNKNQCERLDQQIKHNADLINRNAKLRAALVAIRDHPEEDGVADSMEAIARTALEGDDG